MKLLEIGARRRPLLTKGDRYLTPRERVEALDEIIADVKRIALEHGVDVDEHLARIRKEEDDEDGE